MIEAVNSAAANAILSRGSAPQAAASSGSGSPLESLDGAPEAPKAPFVSPYISIDPNFDRAVLQIRNGETGEVIRQFPSEGRLQQQARDASREQRSPQAPEIVDTQAAQSTSNAEVITVQDVTTNAPSNQPAASPQNAVNALSAGVQTAQTQTTSITVFA